MRTDRLTLDDLNLFPCRSCCWSRISHRRAISSPAEPPWRPAAAMHVGCGLPFPCCSRHGTVLTCQRRLRGGHSPWLPSARLPWIPAERRRCTCGCHGEDQTTTRPSLAASLLLWSRLRHWPPPSPLRRPSHRDHHRQCWPCSLPPAALHKDFPSHPSPQPPRVYCHLQSRLEHSPPAPATPTRRWRRWCWRGRGGNWSVTWAKCRCIAGGRHGCTWVAAGGSPRHWTRRGRPSSRWCGRTHHRAGTCTPWSCWSGSRPARSAARRSMTRGSSTARGRGGRRYRHRRHRQRHRSSSRRPSPWGS